LTAGAFSATTSGERSAKLRDWLQSQPNVDQLQSVFTEMSHRDKGAAKIVRERLDEARRALGQESLVHEWSLKGEALRDAPRLNLADALAWQRDAAKAGAPLSREPLTSLKTALSERIKAIEDLQHQTLVQREAAVLLAQRIEVLSTKPWQDALAQREALQADLDRWNAQAQALQDNAQWASVDAKFPPALQTSAQQVQAVWEAFGEALALTQTAASDANAPLPAVPAWADQIRVSRGEKTEHAAPAPVSKPAGVDSTRVLKPTADKAVIDAQRLALAEQAEALFKPTPAAAAPVEPVDPVVTESSAEAAPAEPVTAPVTAPELVPAMGGRKMQEALRGLREEWKKIDKLAAPNPSLWKRFDAACTRAHQVVDVWLKEARAQTAAHKAQRLALIEEVKTWTETHGQGPDWKNVARQLHHFAQRWRDGGHLSEKMYAELHPLWKTAIHAAHAPLEAVQKASLARRHALIAEAQALGAAPTLRIDAVKALQQRWQEEAHSVVLDRKHEQKLWDAFRQPIDEAFARKSAVRESNHTALSPHDKAVVDAAKALESASASGDANKIRQAMQALEDAVRGQQAAAQTVAPAETDASDAPEVTQDAPSEQAPQPVKPAKPLVAVRGDDRPGQKRTEIAPAKGRDGKPVRKFENRADRPERSEREGFAARGPRLGDVAFRAQRHAMDAAQNAMRQLAAQAHGEVLTQLMQAWEKRDPTALPSAQALGNKLNAVQRTQWSQSLAQSAKPLDGNLLLRLEIAADLPTPAADMSARRALQLQLLTRRNDPAPQMTWAADVAQILASTHDAAQAHRLQAALKVLLKR
jgi:predicted secreted protein